MPIEKSDMVQTEAMVTETYNNTTKAKAKFFTRPVLMPLGIGLSLLVLQQISGIDAIIFFTVEIFHASGR